jgi:hypothetical protein
LSGAACLCFVWYWIVGRDGMNRGNEVEIRAGERRGLREAFPKVGDQVHDAVAAGAEKANGRRWLFDGDAKNLQQMSGHGRGRGGLSIGIAHDALSVAGSKVCD